MDKKYEQIIFYGAGAAAIIVGILLLAGTGGLSALTGVPEGLIVLGFGSLLTGSVVK